MATRSLLDQIEAAAVASDGDIAAALRQCVVLGGNIGSVDLREWATQELKGYPDTHTEELPSYRVVNAPILIDAIVGNSQVTGQPVDPSQLPEVAHEAISNKLPIYFPLGEVQAMIESSKDGSVKLVVPGAQLLGQMIDAKTEFQHVLNIYWSVAVSALHGIVEGVRTALVELVAELRAGMGDGDTIQPDVAGQAVNVAIHGSKNRVTFSANQANDMASIEIASADEGRGKAFYVALVAATAGVIGAIAAVVVIWVR